MRGFVITILSISLIMMLVILVMSIRNAQLSQERSLIEPLPLTYSSFILDDVAFELNSVLGLQIGIVEHNDSMQVSIADTLHDYNHTADLMNYESFLEGEVAGRTASTINANFSNLTQGGTIRVFIDEDYVYTNDHSANESLFTRSGGTNVTSYEINFTIPGVRSNMSEMVFNESGTMNVTIRFTDLNGTVVEQGKVFPDQRSTLRVDYVNGGGMSIVIGSQGGNNGALLMKASRIGAETSWSATLPPIQASKKKGYEYDATIEYAQGAVSKRSRIGR